MWQCARACALRVRALRSARAQRAQRRTRAWELSSHPASQSCSVNSVKSSSGNHRFLSSIKASVQRQREANAARRHELFASAREYGPGVIRGSPARRARAARAVVSPPPPPTWRDYLVAWTCHDRGPVKYGDSGNAEESFADRTSAQRGRFIFRRPSTPTSPGSTPTCNAELAVRRCSTPAGTVLEVQPPVPVADLPVPPET